MSTTPEGETMSEIQSLALRAQGLTQSVDWWNTAMIWALVFVAIAAIAVVVTTRLALVRTKQLADTQDQISEIKESAAKVEQDRIGRELTEAVARAKEADARIAEAQRGSAEANARATKAQESLALAEQHSAEANAKAEAFRLDIAKANESSKQAEARAAEANLELARFKAPRILTQAQQAAIAARLRPFGVRRVDVIIIGDAQEIANLTESIAVSIRQAGWIVKVVGKAISGPNISGVLVGTHTGSDGSTIAASEALISALQSAEIVTLRFTPQFGDELPMAIMGDWDVKTVAPIRILVSAKP